MVKIEESIERMRKQLLTKFYRINNILVDHVLELSIIEFPQV